MSKTLWHTITLEVPKTMVNITKNDKVVVKKTLTKTNNISKANKEPSIKIIPGDTNKPKIISDGKEWNIEELKIRMKKSKELGKKNEGKEYKKKNNIDEKFRKFKNENMAYTNDRSKVQYKKEIKFDKKSRFGGKLFYGTQPSNNFKNSLEVYKNNELTMKVVKDLFKTGYNHIKPDNNIKVYNKMIKDFIDYYNLKVSNNK